MKITIVGLSQIDANKLTITIGEVDYRIAENKFGELIVNKYGGEDSSIHITPIVSNEIKIN